MYGFNLFGFDVSLECLFPNAFMIGFNVVDEIYDEERYEAFELHLGVISIVIDKA